MLNMVEIQDCCTFTDGWPQVKSNLQMELGYVTKSEKSIK
jgi:hypothetical protein